jgi:hypothetical protein
MDYLLTDPISKTLLHSSSSLPHEYFLKLDRHLHLLGSYVLVFDCYLLHVKMVILFSIIELGSIHSLIVILVVTVIHAEQLMNAENVKVIKHLQSLN